MATSRLRVLCLTGFPPSPPTFGAQRRIHGLLSSLSRRHEVTVLSLAGPEFDQQKSADAIRAYGEPILVPARPAEGASKRLLQLRSLFSAHTFEYHHFLARALERRLHELLATRSFDVMQLEIHLFAHFDLRRAPAGGQAPKLVIDAHNVEYDLARQMTAGDHGPLRRIYHEVNWRKLRHEEVAAWSRVDGVAFTSELDRSRALADVPSLRSAVVANAVDVEYFQPRPSDPRPDGRTILFFGTGDYFPNRDGLSWFLREIWPVVSARHPDAKLKVVGPRPTPEVLAARGPRVEVTGLVDDLRPHIAEAAVSIVPLRIGGGTRLKIVEALAMGKAIVSTHLGAEGLDVTHEEDILLADDVASFAASIGRVLDDPALGARLGGAARSLAVRRYSWDSAADKLEAFYDEVLGHQPAGAVANG